MKLSAVGLHPFDTSLVPPDLKALPRAPRRLMEVLLKGSATAVEAAAKSWSLDFRLSPRKFVSAADDVSRVGSCTLERMTLSSAFDPKSHAQPTGETVEMPASIVFRSIGYKSEALPGFSELDIPFDERRGTILNDGLGRVVREVRERDAAISREQYPGLYCSGWVKRGPTGVIAATMEDAFATGDAIVQDWRAEVPFLNSDDGSSQICGWSGVLGEAGNLDARVINWDDWRLIDKAETQQGAHAGKGRGKFTRIADMLAVLQ